MASVRQREVYGKHDRRRGARDVEWRMNRASARLAVVPLAALLLGACAGGTPKSTLPPVTPLMIPPAMAAQPELVGGAWHWQGPEGATAARDLYTIEFAPDGRLVVRADCNRGGGRYTLDAGNRLTLSGIATTKMGCPAGSLDTAYLRQLGEVEGYRFEGETLRLATRGGGTMRFAR
jgi:heat shock protein HslJ